MKQISEEAYEDSNAVKFPKLKKKHKYIKYSQIDKNEKSIIKNYMNAKLVEFKSPKKSA